MTSSDPLARPFDPRVALATTLESQKGVYALLIGSGASTAVGIPTGWGVVKALVRRVAAAAGAEDPGDGWEQWWADHTGGHTLGYSSLIESLASTSATRRALLAGFFEPSDQDRAEGRKVPGDAHRAIAKLVSRGTIRVIVTTNFDRLLEQALEAEGVMPQVIAGESQVAGMEPLPHASATIVKLHGDYGSLDQRNTVAELESYSESLTELLRRILDEYGLIVSGWSGEWDKALVSALESTASRRYPLYWTARESVSELAKQLTARNGSHTIEGTTAEEFFPDLLARVEAVAALTAPPATLAIKLARLRRALPDPVRHLEVRDLFLDELNNLEDWLVDRPRSPVERTYPEADRELDEIAARVQPLLRLFVEGVHLDRDRQHTDLWVWVLQKAISARRMDAGTFTEWWDNLAHYPALLLFRAATMAALTAGHEDVIVKLASEPRWSSIFVQHGQELPGHEVLHLRNVLDDEVLRPLPRWNGNSYYYPSSKLVRVHLLDTATDLAGPGGATRLLDRMEYRMALASHIITPGSNYYRGAAAGEFLGSWPWDDGEEKRTRYTTDFLERGDQAAWGRTREDDEEWAARIDALDGKLRRIRHQ